MAGQRIAVVTGASSGIGEAIARELARTGWHCVLLARRADELERIAGEIGGEWEVCDVSDRAQVDEVAARVLDRHPSIGLLVNNAGMPARGSFLDIDPELVERVTAVNYLGGVWCLRAFAPGLRAAAPRAHVVNLVSVAGTVAFAPRGRVLGVEARPARLLPLDRRAARGRAGSRCTRSCPASSRPRASRSAQSCAARCCGDTSSRPRTSRRPS